MVHGIEVFKEYFRDYQDQYVLIGGAALDLILEQTVVEARATKDLDVVLLIEAITPDFGRKFWSFVRDGGYRHIAKSAGAPQYYRFDGPEKVRFPYMIELLSRNEDVIPEEGQIIVPLSLGDSLSSLSAILLNHDYYSILFEGREIIDGIVVLMPQYLIPFKIKAWLDLTERKSRNEHINSHDIRKHATDVIRLVVTLPGDLKVELPEEVKTDLLTFIKRYEAEPIDPHSMGLKGVTSDDVSDALRSIYGC